MKRCTIVGWCLWLALACLSRWNRLTVEAYLEPNYPRICANCASLQGSGWGICIFDAHLASSPTQGPQIQDMVEVARLRITIGIM